MRKRGHEGFLYLLVVIATAVNTASGGFACPVSFMRVGCFKDNQKTPRPLPVLVFTDRDKSHKLYSGVSINWKKWPEYSADFLCRCAKKTRDSGRKVFGLQFYGECWNDPQKASTYARDGPSNMCIRNDYKKCRVSDTICVGEKHNNFVYTLKDQGNPTVKPTSAIPTEPTKPTKPVTTKTTKPVPTKPTASTNPKCKVFKATVKLASELFTEDLAFPHNVRFINLRLEIEAGVMQVYEQEKAFVGVRVMKYEKVPDGKTLATFVVKFNTESTHLDILAKELNSKKLGKLDTDGKLLNYGCYVPPPPPTCTLPCPSLCAPGCGSSCCGQYTHPAPAPAPVYAPSPPPPPPKCPPPCAPACSPACSPACCDNTSYYGKKHEIPRREKNKKKHN